MLTQNNLASNVEAVKITAEPGTAVLSVLPIHHAFCLVMDWLKGFSLGATAPYGKEYEYFQTGDYAYGSNDDRNYL